MRYMLLIYFEEQTLTKPSGHIVTRSRLNSPKRFILKGQYVAAVPLHPTLDSDQCSNSGRQTACNRRSVCRNTRTARWILPDRRQQPDEAIGIAGRIPMARQGTVEIRPVIDITGLPAN
jgi:hypothetical protein